MNYKTVIWDFNGTLLDDVETGIKSVNTLLERRGLRQLKSRAEYYSIFGFPIRDYYKRLGFDFTKESYSDIADEWIAEYLKNVVSAPLCTGVSEALAAFSREGVTQCVLSATELGMLKKQLTMLGIINYFSSIAGLDNVLAHGKLELARSWAEQMNLENALMLGDTTHDYQVAQALNIDCILIAAGHQTRQTLEECGCPVINTLKELKDYI